MSIKLATRDLVGLLEVLAHTASTDPDEGATAGILLHTARGPRGYEPGDTDMLVGTSTDRLVIGHTNVVAYGQLYAPTLWTTADAKAVTDAFKPKTKGDEGATHQVEIRVADEHVTISEDPNLFDDGFKISFQEADIDDYPRYCWDILGRLNTDPYVRDGQEIPPSRRTDFAPSRLAPFNKVASKINGTIQTYRVHQSRFVQIQIGEHYRGVISPIRYEDMDPTGGFEPSAEVHAPDMPEPVKKPINPAVKVFTPGGLRGGSGVVIAGFPNIPRDTTLVAKVAELVISAQFGSPSMVQRKLRISHKSAEAQLDVLHQHGVVGPANGARARDVLVKPDQLDDVLAALKAGPDTGETASAATASFQLVDEETDDETDAEEDDE